LLPKIVDRHSILPERLVQEECRMSVMPTAAVAGELAPAAKIPVSGKAALPSRPFEAAELRVFLVARPEWRSISSARPRWNRSVPSLVLAASRSRKSCRKYKPNDLMVWGTAIRTKARGFREFVLGSAEAPFKAQFSKQRILVDEWIRDEGRVPTVWHRVRRALTARSGRLR
jgi:hypothetical protein